MANTLGTVNIDGKITKSSYELMKGEKVMPLMNGKLRVNSLWNKRKYTIEFDNQKPELYNDLATLINTNPIQTLTMDKDPWGIGSGISCYCTLSNVNHTAGSVVSNKANYRVTFTLTCEEINPR